MRRHAGSRVGERERERERERGVGTEREGAERGGSEEEMGHGGMGSGSLSEVGEVIASEYIGVISGRR